LQQNLQISDATATFMRFRSQQL